jgi:hypothetical protein
MHSLALSLPVLALLLSCRRTALLAEPVSPAVEDAAFESAAFESATDQDDDPVLGYHLAEVGGFTVITHWHSERSREALARGVAEVADAAWLEAQALLGLEPAAPEPAVAVEVHPDRRAFVQAVLGITGQRPGPRQSWTDTASGSTLVAINPSQGERVYEAFGLPPACVRLATEGAVRTALARRLPNLVREAPWFAEGLAVEVTQRAMVAAGKARETAEEPRFSRLRSDLLLLELGDGNATGLPDLATAPGTKEWTPLHDALAHLVVERVLGDGDLAGSLTQEGAAARLGVFLAAARENGELLTWVMDGLGAWNVQEPDLAGTAAGWYQTSQMGTTALAFRREPVGLEAYRITGEVMLFPTPRQTCQMNVLFGLAADGSYFSLALTETNGAHVFYYSPEKETFLELESNLEIPIRPLEPTRFVLELKEGRLFAVVNGVSIPVVELGGRDVSGPWGLGAQRTGAGLWLSHEVSALDE